MIDLEEEGYKNVCILNDGQVAAVIDQGGNSQIRIGLHQYGYEEMYTYRTMGQAYAAMERWKLSDDEEPDLWIRHQPSNRRRENGDPEKETIRP